MRTLSNILVTILFAMSTKYVLAGQQTQPVSQAQGASHAAVLQIVTGCLVRNDHGYSLMTESNSYFVETEKDLEQYADKQITVAGVLEQQPNVAASTSLHAAFITNLRLRMVASVVGDCNRRSD